MIVDYTKETRDKLINCLTWYLYTYKNLDVTKTPSPEELSLAIENCRKDYDMGVSALKGIVQSAISKIDDILLTKRESKN